MTVGATHDPARFGRRRANVRVERWIRQQVLLPHCDAVVTHGGYGTLSATLSAGRPVVCIPISADQPQNAARCAALGAGRVVHPDDRTAGAIRRATRAVLDDRRHRLAAERVARDSRRQPGLDDALDLLETLARDRVPLPRATSRRGRRRRGGWSAGAELVDGEALEALVVDLAVGSPLDRVDDDHVAAAPCTPPAAP